VRAHLQFNEGKMDTQTHFFGLWNCPNCGRTPLISEQLHCPSCGKDIPLKEDGYPETRMPNESEISKYEISNAGIIGRIERREGVWECRFCQGVHPDEDGFCAKCGASKAGVAKDAEVEKETTSTYVTRDSSDAKEDEPAEEPKWTPAEESYLSPAFKSKPKFSLPTINLPQLLISLVVGLAILVGGIWGYREFMVRQTLPATIQSVSWSRTMPVEIFTWVSDNNQSGCPSGSRECTSGREVVGSERYQSGSHQEPIYSSRSVPDGETCTTSQNPDGSYTRSCSPKTRTETYISSYDTVPDYSYRDVYGTVYRFEVQQWIFSRNLTTSGDNWEPFWYNDYVLGRDSEPERLSGNNSESYSIVLVTADGETHRWSSGNEAEWKAFQSGAALFEVILNGNGRLISAGRQLVEE